MLEKMIAFMLKENWDLDAISLSESLWITRQFSAKTENIDDSEDDILLLKDTEEEELNEFPISITSLINLAFLVFSHNKLYKLTLWLVKNQTSISYLHPIEEITSDDSPQYPLTPSTPSSREEETTSTPPSVKVPDSNILRHQLELGRRLRVLKQKISSRIDTELDIAATVNMTAELSTPDKPIFFPIRKPKLERSLDLALIVEKSESMIIWEDLIPELQDFFLRLGAFRDFKTYQLTYQQNQVKISPISSPKQTISPEQLLDANGRRLILFVSDTLSSQWYDGSYSPIFKTWSTKGLLTILNPFPELLWSRTAIDYLLKIQLSNDRFGKPSQQWQANPFYSWQEAEINQDTGIKVPLLTLEPEYSEAWANVLTGKNTSICGGICLEEQYNYQGDVEEQLPENPQQAINDYYATSSPIAWQMIQYLAAIPVTLATVRLVQQTFFNNSTTPVHVAEVLMGGLLTTEKELKDYQSGQHIYFNFKPGIREYLLETIKISRGLGDNDWKIYVVKKIGEKLAQRFGKSLKEFEAQLLTNPLELCTEAEINSIQAFATITAKTLSQCGRKYQSYVADLEKISTLIYKDQTNQTETTTEPNWIDFLQALASQHQLTPTQTITLTTHFLNSDYPGDIEETAKLRGIKPDTVKGHLRAICRQLKTTDLYKYLLERFNQYLITEEKAIPYLNYSFSARVTSVVLQAQFKTIYVNARGETIQEQECQAYCYQELLAKNQPSTSIMMMQIPSGEFLMGSPEDEEKRFPDRESPQHPVKVAEFWMSQTPITQAQWRFVVNLPKEGTELSHKSANQGDEHPVTRVSWRDAVEFCARLSRYTGRNYRLPSEAEWEYACRAGTTTPFHFGDTITSNLANYNVIYQYKQEPTGEYREGTTPVKIFPPNGFGLYDMHGNVLEWCIDSWHNNYQGAPDNSRAWDDDYGYHNDYLNNTKKILGSKSMRVIRGGSWYINPGYCRSASRNYVDPGYDLNDSFGFRVACFAREFS